MVGKGEMEEMEVVPIRDDLDIAKLGRANA
jgi:hypothetical protein